MHRPSIEQQILEETQKGNHVLLTGKHGVGKSYIARRLAKENGWIYFPLCKPPRQIFLAVIEVILGDANPRLAQCRRATVIQLIGILSDLLEELNLNVIIVLDEFHTVTSNACASYFLLMQQSKRITFLTLATTQYLNRLLKKPEMKRFFWELNEIEVRELDNGERAQFISELAPNLKENDRKRISKQSKGNVLAIVHSIKRLKTEDEGKMSGVIGDEGVNLFPLFIMVLVSFVALRYLFRGMGDYEMASIASFIGLMALFFARYSMRAR